MRSEFGKRLFEARKRAGLTQADAAKGIMGQSTLAELEKSGQGSAHTTALAKRYGVLPDWLADGTPPMTHANVVSGPDIKGSYPLISDVQAGMWTEICDNFQPGDAEQWLPSTKNLGAHGYMLRVSGDSMKDPGARYSFPDGTILHVNPSLVPQVGQFVVARREATKQATFKKYVMIEGEPYLEAINPDWPKEMRFLKLQPGDVWCGVVVDASMGVLP